MPVFDGWDDSHFNDFVAELAQMFVALFQFFLFGRCSRYFLISNAIFGDRSFHCHHDMIELPV